MFLVNCLHLHHTHLFGGPACPTPRLWSAPLQPLSAPPGSTLPSAPMSVLAPPSSLTLSPQCAAQMSPWGGPSSGARDELLEVVHEGFQNLPVKQGKQILNTLCPCGWLPIAQPFPSARPSLTLVLMVLYVLNVFLESEEGGLWFFPSRRRAELKMVDLHSWSEKRSGGRNWPNLSPGPLQLNFPSTRTPHSLFLLCRPPSTDWQLASDCRHRWKSGCKGTAVSIVLVQGAWLPGESHQL